MFFNGRNPRIRVWVKRSSLDVSVAPVGLCWAVVLRLGVVAAMLMPLIGDPRELAWPRLIFWALMLVGAMVFLVHTLRLARRRSRLFLDRKTAKLTSATLSSFENYACPLQEFQLGAVGLSESNDGEQAADTYCLQLGFGTQKVQAFVGHDEAELRDLRDRLSTWPQASAR